MALGALSSYMRIFISGKKGILHPILDGKAGGMGSHKHWRKNCRVGVKYVRTVVRHCLLFHCFLSLDVPDYNSSINPGC
jgi:hypothetical protein